MTELEITIKNLKIGLDMLPKLAYGNPAIENHFNMGIYGCYSLSGKDNMSCKTFGCLLGNLGRCFDLTDDSYYHKGTQRFEYELFAMKVFPFLYEDVDFNNKWTFLFDTDWADFQPTFTQGLERIAYFIKHNGEFEWEYQKESFV